MDYILGLSGGGGTTSVSIATLGGTMVRSFTVGAINLLFASEEQAAHNFAEAFVTAQLAGYPVKSCRQVCAGVAGLSVQSASATLATALRGVMLRCGYTGDALLLGDEQIALAGALQGGEGMILIAGDSSVCFGQNAAGRQHTTGGMGLYCDDDGSAFAAGREMLRAVVQAGDGRSPFTQLSALLYRKFSLLGNADLTRWLRGGGPTQAELCELAALLPQACQGEDKAALAIVSTITQQLANLVDPVVKRLALQNGTLAVAGKILLGDAFIGIAFKREMSTRWPELQCVPPRADSAAGAVLLAKKRLALRGYH